jgi:ribosomal protein S18 acetylase RimI-like enzyme
MDADRPFEPYKRIIAKRPLTEALKEGVGSRKKNIKGTANQVKKLFYDLKKLIRGRTVDGRKMQVNDLFNNIPNDLEQDIIRLLKDQNVNIGSIIEVQIHAKSDPEGWVCGNYTNCCMPFGSAENKDYMFNPSTQYFTVKYNDRIVAQSVVVDANNIEDGRDVVILDNIEVVRNYKHLAPLLAKAYQIFWTEYTTKEVKVGTGHLDLIPPGAKLEKNVYELKTSLFFSDAQEPRIYGFPKMRNNEPENTIVTFANLTMHDAKSIAEMEQETYPKEMTHGIEYIENIIRKEMSLDLSGAAASFIVKKGCDNVGYLLVLPEDSEINDGEQFAHIYDIVVLPKFQGMVFARKMMERVLDAAINYGVPIEAEARASNSYKILMNPRVIRWFKSKGFNLTANKKNPDI